VTTEAVGQESEGALAPRKMTIIAGIQPRALTVTHR
jgi:hypothetical protein